MKLKNYTFIFYIKHIIFMAITNKLRFLLSILGIVVGIFIFSIGNIFIDSYYTTRLNYISDMDESSIILKTNDFSSELSSKLYEISNNIPNITYGYNINKTITSLKISEDRVVTLSANIKGINEENNKLIITNNENQDLVLESELVKGRLIDYSDIANQEPVVVIDEFIEKLLFSNEDSLGKRIIIGETINTSGKTDGDKTIEEIKELVVVGVVKNSYYSECEELKLKREIKEGKDKIFINTNMYCPNTIVSKFKDLEESGKNKFYIWNTNNSIELFTLESNINEFIRLDATKGLEYEIITKNSLLEELKKTLEPIKIFLNLITIILFVLSGINIMTILFFSVKERISEIGIRKAFGANKIDIMFQFLFEGALIGLIGSIIAVIISCILSTFIQEYIEGIIMIKFELVIMYKQILLPIMLGILEGIVFSFIPSIYASNIMVTEALRFE